MHCRCRCLSACVTWTSYVDHNSVFAVHLVQFRTLTDCLSYCSSNERCVAVDFDSSDEPCWVHTDINDLSFDNTYGLPGVTQYRISRTCSMDGTYTDVIISSSSRR